MAKLSITDTQKYAIVLVVIAAAAVLLAPLLLQQAAPSQKAGDPEAFFSNVGSSPKIAIIADITGAQTQAAKTAILQCSVDLRSNIITALGKNTVYIACEGSNCLVSESNEANTTKPISPSGISNATFGMPQFYISYGKPIDPAYFADKAHFWVNDTLTYPCSIYSIETQNATAAGNASQ
ncbi:Uncharacterised protein [Candidatus Anstonella stagnisolia]|nr:Uncharacterised protein [Candidatus Anstonella stagnisolia]